MKALPVCPRSWTFSILVTRHQKFCQSDLECDWPNGRGSQEQLRDEPSRSHRTMGGPVAAREQRDRVLYALRSKNALLKRRSAEVLTPRFFPRLRHGAGKLRESVIKSFHNSCLIFPIPQGRLEYTIGSMPATHNLAISDNQFRGLWMNLRITKFAATIGLSIISYVTLARAIAHFYHPDLAALLQRAREILSDTAWQQGTPQPLPLQPLLLFLGYLIFPFLLIFYDRVLHSARIDIYLRLAGRDAWCTASVIIALVAVTFLILRTPTGPVGISNMQYYFSGWPLIGHPFFSILYLAFWLDVFIYDRTWRRRLSRRVGRRLSNLALAGHVFFVGLLYFKTIEFFPADLHHFNAVYYSVTQVVAGTPLLLNGFTNTYGLYPHFLSPFFKVVRLDPGSFTGLFATLLVLSYLFIFLFLRNVVTSQRILFLGLSCWIAAYFTIRFESAGNYLQYHPLRTVFPAISLWFASLYAKKPSSTLAITGYLIASAAVLWNPDTGVVVWTAWCALLCFVDVARCGWRSALMPMARHFLTGVAAFGAVWLTYASSINLVYGGWPPLAELLLRSFRFSQLSLMTLPIPLVHMWNLYVLAALIGLAIAVGDIREGLFDPRTASLFYLSALSLGLLGYYEQRSHPSTFFAVWGYFFGLLTLFADRLWSTLQASDSSRKSVPLWSFFGYILFYLAQGSLSLAFNASTALSQVKTQPLWLLLKGPAARYEAMTVRRRDRENIDLIRRHARRGEKIILWGFPEEEGIYMSASGSVSAVNPGDIDRFLRVDEDRFLNAINGGRYKTFVSASFLAPSPSHALTVSSARVLDRTPSICYIEDVRVERPPKPIEVGRYH